MPSQSPQARRRLARPLLLLVALAMPLAIQLGAGAASVDAAEGNVRLSPPMSSVPADQGPFTVYVVLEDLQHAGNVTYDDNRDGTPDRSIPSQGLGAFQFTIEYDEAIVEFQEAERGPNLSITGRSFQCLPAKRDPGEITFGCLSPGSDPAGPQGDLTLASVQFSPRGSGLSPLVLSAEVAGPLGDSAEVDVGGGAVRVNGNTQAEPTEPVAVETIGTPSAPEQTASSGTATTVAETSEAASTPGTPGRTPASPVTDTSSTPIPTTTNPPPTEDDESSYLWLWLLGVGVALTLGAGGLMAILGRRRAQGGL